MHTKWYTGKEEDDVTQNVKTMSNIISMTDDQRTLVKEWYNQSLDHLMKMSKNH